MVQILRIVNLCFNFVVCIIPVYRKNQHKVSWKEKIEVIEAMWLGLKV